MAKPSALIFGYGYLGKRVGALLQQQDYQLFATTRSEERAEELKSLDIEPVVCDVCNPSTLESLPAVETVIYCIGMDCSSGRSMREVYVDGLLQVLKKLPQPKRFLYVSSTGVYGQTDGSIVDESSKTEPQEESGKVVLEAETVLHEHAPDAVILRFAGIYGPGRLLRAKAISAGEPIVGDSEKWLSLIHVEDGATAVLAAEKHAQPGRIYNVSDGCSMRRREYYTELAKVLGAPEPQFVNGPEARSANRRVCNLRMLDELHVELHYPDFRQGLQS